MARAADGWLGATDYHPQLFKNPLPVEQPTIFAARYSDKKVSAPLLVGAVGKLHEAIDLFPSLAYDTAGVLWCAWDCSEPRRSIQLARLKRNPDTFETIRAFGQRACSTPELSAAVSGQLLLTWSEMSAAGRWQGRAALLRDGMPVRETTLTENADVMFPKAKQAPDGRFWVVYEKTDRQSSQVVLREITNELK